MSDDNIERVKVLLYTITTCKTMIRTCERELVDISKRHAISIHLEE